MGHVDEQGGADLVGDLAHLGEVDPPRVGGVAGHQHQRLELLGLGPHHVVVEQPGLRVGAVLLLVEHLPGDVRAEAVGEVAAGVERHAEQPLVAELVAQLLPVLVAELVDVLGAELLQPRALDPVGEDRPVRDQVGVDAGVRLRIGVRRTEQLARVLGGERLDRVDVLAAGVEAVPDRALGVLVAEPGAHGQQHRRRGVVLAGDQLERGALVGELLAGRVGDPRLDAGDHLQGLVVGTADEAAAGGDASAHAEDRRGEGVLITVTPLLGTDRRCDLRRTRPRSARKKPAFRPDHETCVHIMRFRFVERQSED